MSGMWIPLFTVAMSAEMGRLHFVEDGLVPSLHCVTSSSCCFRWGSWEVGHFGLSGQGSADSTAILNLSQPIREQGF